MRAEMPPNTATQKRESQPWTMDVADDPLLVSSGSCSYGNYISLNSGQTDSLSSSPKSQLDSGLQSSDGLSEDEVEEARTLTKQSEAEFHRLPRAAKAERPGPKPQSAPYQKSSRPGSPRASAAKPGPLEQLEKVAAATSEAERWLAGLVAAIQVALGVEKFKDFQCVPEAQRIVEVTKLMAEGHQLHHFLRVFGHSASCHNTECVKPCLMFRRIRGHLVALNHECAIVHVYSQLTRMHVDTCVTEKCGFPTCKGLQAYRAREKKEVLPRNFYLLERDNAQDLAKEAPAKKDAGKENQKHVDANAVEEGAEPKPTAETLVKKGVADETREALDLSHRVSKLAMGSSTQSQVTPSA